MFAYIQAYITSANLVYTNITGVDKTSTSTITVYYR